jgi:hypothetical protein
MAGFWPISEATPASRGVRLLSRCGHAITQFDGPVCRAFEGRVERGWCRTGRTSQFPFPRAVGIPLREAKMGRRFDAGVILIVGGAAISCR